MERPADRRADRPRERRRRRGDRGRGRLAVDGAGADDDEFADEDGGQEADRGAPREGPERGRRRRRAVRARLGNLLGELASMYAPAGLAGIELDFERSLDYFPASTPDDERRTLMMGFVRDIRAAILMVMNGISSPKSPDALRRSRALFNLDYLLTCPLLHDWRRGTLGPRIHFDPSPPSRGRG